MNTHAPLSENSDYELMERLADYYERRARADADTSAKGMAKEVALETRLVREVERRTSPIISAATKTLPDPEAAYSEAWYTLVSPQMVTYYIEKFSLEPGATLAKLAFGVARKNNRVKEAGLAGDKQRRKDPYYHGATSLEEMRENGHDIAGSIDARPLSQVEAEKRARIRDIREGFQEVAAGSKLTEKQKEVILRYGNLHVDDALSEMAKLDAVAKSMRITRQTVSEHLAAARANVANDIVLSTVIYELCGSDSYEGIDVHLEGLSADLDKLVGV